MPLAQAGAATGAVTAAEPEPIVSIVMPCLNEAETLGVCVREAWAALAAAGVAGEVLVADNGSSDGSQALARAAGARVVEVAGARLRQRAGRRHRRGPRPLRADGRRRRLLRFRRAAAVPRGLRGGADLVMGCRLPAGGGRILPGAMPWKHRWIGNPVLTALGRLFFTAPVHDFHCGLRAFRRDAVAGPGPAVPGHGVRLGDGGARHLRRGCGWPRCR